MSIRDNIQAILDILFAAGSVYESELSNPLTSRVSTDQLTQVRYRLTLIQFRDPFSSRLLPVFTCFGTFYDYAFSSRGFAVPIVKLFEFSNLLREYAGTQNIVWPADEPRQA